jgi:hydroxypyruvate isomerase
MPRLAANLTMLFTEYPTLDRFERAAAAGFAGVELLFPYADDAESVLAATTKAGVEYVLFNLPAGDWAAGDRGLAADPGRQQEFLAGLPLAVEYASVLRPSRINCLAGKSETTGATRQSRPISAPAAAALDPLGITLTVEHVNSFDVAGFALPTTQDALDAIAAADAPNVALQFDVYHSLRMGEDPFAYIAANGPTIGHIQIADVPGRHQPGSGTIDWERLFEVIDNSGYTGWVSLEYVPDGPTEEGFGLLRDLGRAWFMIDASFSRDSR